MIACYSDVLSAHPGRTVRLHVSSASGRCDIEVARVGAVREIVLTAKGIAVGDHPVPPDADRDGCDWPVAIEVRIDEAWRSGYYDIHLTSGSGETARHFICVKSKPRARRAKAALILATNTYQAYNWWGGRSSYCDVAAVVSRKMSLVEGLRHGLGVLSRRRPFAPGIMYVPESPARLINAGPRDFQALPVMKSPAYYARLGLGPMDGPAGFINKWEHEFVRWAEAAGIELDYWTDYDLEVDRSALDGYSAAIVVGHSEYWSSGQRDQLDRFVDNGGNLAVFSGNTSYWKVRWEDGGDRLICHKSRGFDAEPDAGADASHFWSHPAFGRPEAALIGLSFLFGGYHRLGMCVARGTAGYTVYDDEHWALKGADLFYGDNFGGDVPLLGYENDGCLFQFGDDGKLKAVPHLGVPANLEIIAMAPTGYAEDLTRGYRPLLPPENVDAAARVVYGDAGEATRRRLCRGHAVMASFRRGKGEVFNAGTTEWVYGLKARNPFVEAITRNVLTKFGVLQSST